MGFAGGGAGGLPKGPLIARGSICAKGGVENGEACSCVCGMGTGTGNGWVCVAEPKTLATI